MTHAFEGMDHFDANGVVAGPVHSLEEVGVLEKVGVTEVEFDLFADGFGVVCFGEVFIVRFGVVLVATVSDAVVIAVMVSIFVAFLEAIAAFAEVGGVVVGVFAFAVGGASIGVFHGAVCVFCVAVFFLFGVVAGCIIGGGVCRGILLDIIYDAVAVGGFRFWLFGSCYLLFDFGVAGVDACLREDGTRRAGRLLGGDCVVSHV